MDKVELKILKNKQVKTQKQLVSCAGNPTGSCFNEGNKSGSCFKAGIVRDSALPPQRTALSLRQLAWGNPGCLNWRLTVALHSGLRAFTICFKVC